MTNVCIFSQIVIMKPAKCRICAGKKSLISILDPKNKELIDVLKLCANIEVKPNDKLPKHICEQCKQGLETAYKLRKLGEENAKKLENEMDVDEDESEDDGDEQEEEVPEEETEVIEILEEFVDDSNDEDFKLAVEDEQEDAAENEEFLEELDDEHNDNPNSQVKEEIKEEKYSIMKDPLTDDNGNTMAQRTRRGRKRLTTGVTVEIHNPEAEIATPSKSPSKPIAQRILKEEIPESDDTSQDQYSESQVNEDEVPNWEELTESFNNDEGKLVYQCAVCGLISSNKTKHIPHVLKHTGQLPFKCKEKDCSKGYRTQNDLNRHMASHLEERKFMCEICSAAFKSMSNLYHHKRKHNKKFSCRFCSGGFYNRYTLRMHEMRHAPGKKLETCDICQKTFSTVVMLNNHKSNDHGIEKQALKKTKEDKLKVKEQKVYDNEIERILDSQKDIAKTNTKWMDYTEKLTNEEGKLRYKCTVCGHLDRQQNKHIFHVLKHTGEKPYQCELPGCSNTFRSRYMLKRHLEHHNEERRFKCDICHSTFKDKCHLTRHTLLHDKNNKRHKCKFCSARFYESREWKKHEGLHKPNETLRPCNICDEFYLNGLMLNNHMEEEHGIRTAKRPKKNQHFVEDQPLNNLEEEYEMDALLQDVNVDEVQGGQVIEMVTVPEGSEIFEIIKFKDEDDDDELLKMCGICGESFTDMASLNEHIDHEHEMEVLVDEEVVSTQEESLEQCDICEMYFLNIGMLNEHIKTEHDIEIVEDKKNIVKSETDLVIDNILNSQKDVEKNNTRWLEFTERITTEEGKLRYRCTVCGEIGTQDKHIPHVLKHTGEKPFVCKVDECTNSFRMRAHLKRHLEMHFEQGNHECDVCNDTFKDRWSLKKHKLLHDSNSKRFHCSFCSATFIRARDWRNHESRHKPDEVLKGCDLCEKSFSSGILLANHKLKEHGVKMIKEKREESLTEVESEIDKTRWLEFTETFTNEDGKLTYKCTVCEKTGTKAQHIPHVLAHTGERPFKCLYPGCSNDYTSRRNLKRHTEIHEKEDGYQSCDSDGQVKTFKCESCSAAFSTQRGLKIHERRHNVECETLLPCDLCDKFFLNEVMLSNHRNSEHGVKQEKKRKTNYVKFFQKSKVNKIFQCRFCPEKFTDLDAFNEHEEDSHD